MQAAERLAQELRRNGEVLWHTIGASALNAAAAAFVPTAAAAPAVTARGQDPETGAPI